MPDRQYTILIVEDDRANAYLYRQLLAASISCGFPFIFFTEVVDRLSLAVARLQAANGIDAVLLDLSLRDAIGMEALDAILRISDLPIIIITGSIDPVNAARALERGAQAVYAKPLVSTPEQFINGVWSAVHRQRHVNALKKELAKSMTVEPEASAKPPMSKITIAGIIAGALTGLTALVAGLVELIKAWKSK